MKRLFALGLAVSLLQTSMAFAAGPLSSIPASTEKTQSSTGQRFMSFAEAARVGVAQAQKPGVLAQQQGGAGTIAQSGLSKRTKTVIFAGVAAAFVGIAYGIDHRVRDVTPSSLGTREDNSVFGK